MTLPTAHPNPTTPAWPMPRWIAHRGAGRHAPENTLAAFRLGAEFGYRAFECDVKLSADGVPVLLHDATVARTTNGQGDAAQLSWHALSQLDAGSWRSAKWAGEPLATLAGVAAFTRANGCALNIEIKPSPGQAATTGRAVALAAEALWPEIDAPLLLSSFQPAALAAAREAAPRLLRALLVDSPPLSWENGAEADRALPEGWSQRPTDWWTVSEALDCAAVVAHHPLIDAAFVQRLHAAGRRALTYTVNTAEEAHRLLAIGIDGIITDAVDQFDPREAPATSPAD